jgi:NAD-dependent deacetylase
MGDLRDYERASRALKQASCVLALTGAGASAESGVPTFRASDGLWEGHSIEDVATPEGYRRNPELVWSFYNARRVNVAKVAPNPGHLALVQLERRFQPHFTLVTQNVDGLHTRAGNGNVAELHGNLARTRCPGCGRIEVRGYEDLGPRPVCPHCGGPIRPDIVWFHEMLPPGPWTRAEKAARECDVLLVVGTSAVVYPAAGLITLAKRRPRPAFVIECNLAPTDASDLADVGLYGPAGQTLPRLFTHLEAA